MNNYFLALNRLVSSAQILSQILRAFSLTISHHCVYGDRSRIPNEPEPIQIHFLSALGNWRRACHNFSVPSLARIFVPTLVRLTSPPRRYHILHTHCVCNWWRVENVQGKKRLVGKLTLLRSDGNKWLSECISVPLLPH
jgi:hypothetical protein